ncbi:ABC transporter substrate-binding protein [Deinococcus aquiradiocola]|uniref:Iron ABC transporter substrate-binding protein n=1 Tax=Deinococcus aquiradiocola TaxID=393059 RepID=A0A917PD00_9DEIO|nr:ABC transporter substrate-binding protein [Deinococcus aquiradiocola]GGJ71096.1 iron ABC transporter substrate-binding protein [Deinococcus aquiradiocola]
MKNQLARLTLLLIGAGSVVALAQTMTMAPALPAALVNAAKKDGSINTIALPPDWANYGEIMDSFQKAYGLKLTNASPDASSAEELQAIRSLKGQRRAPDVVDVGPAFAIQGTTEKLFTPYKPSTWASIPASAKDKDGYWVGNYFGVISFGVNKSIVKNVPKTWADLLKPEYKGQVALNGNPLSAQAAFSAVWSAALANGGSLDNIQPGIDFFAKLKANGNYIPVGATPATVQTGQTPIVADWDYLNLGYSKQFAGKVEWTVTVPSDGVYGSHYATAINASAPNPSAAKLWEEFILSDAGQLMFLKGYAHPIRFNDMVKRGVIGKDILATLPDAAVYQNVKFATPAQVKKAQDVLKAQWAAKVGQ